MEREDNKIKAIVAMSGGVDSSVAAALLKKAGYDVVGVFMHFWMEDKGCASGSEQAARAVANKLKIPFQVLDVRRVFKKEVVDYFLSEQRRSRTPNPCVVCNKKIKFGVFLKKALGPPAGGKADCVATGHYVKIKQDDNIVYKIFAAKDETKDQSYFLHQLNQRQLSKVIFPLGEYTKEEVKKMAKLWHLPCQKEQSFDLCFIKGEPAGFIKKYLKLKTGDVVEYQKNKKADSVRLGRHEGLPLYTIGQRKNILVGQGLPAGRQGPWWVIKKDEKKNILYISNNEKDLYSRELIVEKVNWLGGIALKLPIKALVKIRYKSEAGEARVSQIANRKLRVDFKKAQRAITPGQSAVFYSEKGELLGGGVIK
ncbi:MAG: tRNA-specific 2-thiouridylase MnmA [Parcubacteria group bacterium GW2011_GWC2_42_6]|nr:MAG: tRNA-specific 2-thiouridylase MnmA [Parcubacteria group bacterium GW2011_GWA2_42_11]KKS66237.1 MAG: tRNA-specific 2-thiouridylase MnmA [Parcubacteria group bacterium GW2011_GWC2_42_6]KKT76778.1 MAG: tRNA-specific 2-thiouridylase MnmA [Parcubacteria group bacterium GW2011_GWF2_44_7]